MAHIQAVNRFCAGHAQCMSGKCTAAQLTVRGYNLLLQGTTCCYRTQLCITQFVPQGTQVHHSHAEPYSEDTLHEHRKDKHCLHSTRNALHCGTDNDVCRPPSSQTIQLRFDGSHYDSESVYACRGRKLSTSQIGCHDKWCKCLCPA